MEVIDNAIEEAGKHNATRIKEIYLGIGRLSMVNPEQMKFALELLSKKTIAEGARIKLRILPLRVECGEKHVNKINPRETHPYDIIQGLRCPECNGKVRILGGRECILQRIIAE